MRNTLGIISCPRYGPLINTQCAFEAFGPLEIPMAKHHGAWWHHSLSELMEQAIAEGRDYVMGLDYDTIFNERMVRGLLSLMGSAPDADAICAVQAHRGHQAILATPLEEIKGPLTKCKQAHFGLTVFRTKSLDDLPRPWFVETPDKNGRWSDQKTDADVGFWNNWFEHGKTLYQANNIVIGHLVEAIIWPAEDGRNIIYQSLAHWLQSKRPPPGVFHT